MRRAEDHPVLAAVADERERLTAAVDAANANLARIEEEREQFQRELDALDRIEATVGDVISPNGEAPAPASPPQVSGRAPAPPPDSTDEGETPAAVDAKGRRLRPQQIEAAEKKERAFDAVRRASLPIARRDLLAATSLTNPELTTALRSLVKEGRVRQLGKGRWTTYEVIEAKRTLAPPAARKAGPSSEDLDGKGRKPDPERDGTLEGRVLTYLITNPDTAAGCAVRVGAHITEVRPVLGKLLREGDVRTRKSNGETIYAGMP